MHFRAMIAPVCDIYHVTSLIKYIYSQASIKRHTQLVPQGHKLQNLARFSLFSKILEIWGTFSQFDLRAIYSFNL